MVSIRAQEISDQSALFTVGLSKVLGPTPCIGGTSTLYFWIRVGDWEIKNLGGQFIEQSLEECKHVVVKMRAGEL